MTFVFSKENLRNALLRSNSVKSVVNAYDPKLNVLEKACVNLNPKRDWWVTLSIRWKEIAASLRARLAIKSYFEYTKFLLQVASSYEGFKEMMNSHNPDWWQNVTDEFNLASLQHIKSVHIEPQNNFVISTADFQEVFNQTFPSESKDLEPQLILRLLTWWPMRNDINLKLTPLVDERRTDGNLLLITPDDDEASMAIHIQEFKTSSFSDRFIVRRTMPSTLTALVRRYIAETDRKMGEFLFGTDKDTVLQAKVEKALAMMGISGGVNWLRRFAASNMSVQVLAGNKSDEQEAILAAQMMHSYSSHERYIVAIKKYDWLVKQQQKGRKRKSKDISDDSN